MFNFKKQQNKFSLYWNTRKYKLSFLGVRPFSDWMLLVITGFILLIIVCSVSYIQFVNLSKQISVNPVSVQSKGVDLDEINKIISGFELKRKDFKYSTVVVPKTSTTTNDIDEEVED